MSRAQRLKRYAQTAGRRVYRGYGWGQNDAGQCGSTSSGPLLVPREFNKADDMQQHHFASVHAGFISSAAVTAQGTLRVWGANTAGALFMPGPTDQLFDLPYDPALGETITQVYAGRHHIVALTGNGRVITGGDDVLGSEMKGHKVHQMKDIGIDDVVVDIASGLDHVIALTEHGELYTWGLVLGHEESLVEPTLVANPSQSKVRQVLAGPDTTGVVDDEGVLWLWGDNDDGKLASHDHKSMLVGPVSVDLPGRVLSGSVGGKHSLALLEDGSVWGWGRSHNGVLAQPVSKKEPIQTPTQIDLPGPAKLVSAGWAHNVVALEDNSVYSWGVGEGGRLGIGGEGTTGAPTQVQLPLEEVFAISAGVEHSLVVGVADTT